jgi:hypothetical protein
MTRNDSVIDSASRRLIVIFATLATVALAVALIPAAASAGSKTVWLCKPGKPHNPCESGLNTTLITHGGKNVRVKDVKADQPRKIDCFYVYPTVSDQQTDNANLHIDPEERSIALYQAARYSQHCRVFAPMYRQVTLKGIFGTVTPHMSQVAYNSALQGWRDYMANYNNGRPVVLIGHSQGTFVLRQLIAQEIDPDPQVRSQLVSAILLGGNVTVKQGKNVGGDFQNIPACRSSAQIGCVMAFSTFNAPVPSDAVFGRTTTPGLEVLCTNPAALGGGAALLDTVLPSKPFAPDTSIGATTRLIGFPEIHASTPFVESRGAYSGSCSSADGADVLQLTDQHGSADLRPLPNAGWGLHLTDANIALGDLVKVVHQQETAFLAGGG